MAHSILILGAGRSSSSLISYLIGKKKELELSITVGDISLSLAREKIGADGNAILFDILKPDESKNAIHESDIVISLLPAAFHPQVAALCIELKKHLLTASYVSEPMRSYDAEAKKHDLLFLNECGLDPGLDHMTAMDLIDKIKDKGGELESFESFTGGLIAPATDPENPWRYKFTWNPRNVVLAGQGTAKYLENNKSKFIPYQQLFRRTTSIIIPGQGEFEGYANRDSLSYLKTYGLQKVKTMIRGTLRNKGYCSAWDIFVQLGCTDDAYEINNIEQLTHRDFLELFLPEDGVATEQKISKLFSLPIDSHKLKCLKWSGFFDEEIIGLAKGTPAQILEHILNKKWALKKDDKDLVVMWHRLRYKIKNESHEIQASLTAVGDDAIHTAMAKTVGLPLAIATELFIKKKITKRGVVIPISKDIYQPILKELKTVGIALKDH